MRKLLRYLKKIWGGWRIRKRRDEIALLLQDHFSLSLPPQMTPVGGRGHDSIYVVADGAETFGILRLINPYLKRTPPAQDMPFILPDARHRIEREWYTYQVGAARGLTPRSLWRTEDALLCEYLPYRSLHSCLLEQPENVWNILSVAATAITRLHAAGITHMDISLTNMLGDKTLSKIYFIDFEYVPAAGVSLPAQKVYDHLRLLESTLKFIPHNIADNYQAWLQIFTTACDEEMKNVSLAQLEPALGRILRSSVSADIRRLING